MLRPTPDHSQQNTWKWHLGTCNFCNCLGNSKVPRIWHPLFQIVAVRMACLLSRLGLCWSAEAGCPQEALGHWGMEDMAVPGESRLQAGARQTQDESQNHQLVSGGPWGNYLTSLAFGFLIGKMRIRIPTVECYDQNKRQCIVLPYGRRSINKKHSLNKNNIFH